MKAEDLVLFILSHKSPNKCETLDCLKKLNFKGKIYIIIDDEDDCIEEYKEKYKDNLLIFHKQKYRDEVDMGFSISGMPTYAHSVFGRNAAEDFAKSMRLDHYIISDDDVYNFNFRLMKGKSLPCIQVKDINEPLLAYYEYMKEANLACVCPGTPNIYFGGIKAIQETGGLKRRAVTNFYLRNMNYDIKWSMSIDDYSTSIRYGVIGYLFLPLYPLQVMVRPQYTQKGGKKTGGMASYYANTSSWTRSMPSFLACPSFVSIRLWKGNYIPFLKKNCSYPMIISDKYHVGDENG